MHWSLIPLLVHRLHGLEPEQERCDFRHGKHAGTRFLLSKTFSPEHWDGLNPSSRTFDGLISKQLQYMKTEKHDQD
jgi:hypothetical protein